jgi:hypothetical protein
MQQSQQACGLLKQWSRAQQDDFRHAVCDRSERIEEALREIVDACLGSNAVCLVNHEQPDAARCIEGRELVERHDVNLTRELLLKTKFFGQFSAPLARQRWRDGNQYRARRVVEQVLTNQNSSLNRLPEADLVGQEVALRHIA